MSASNDRAGARSFKPALFAFLRELAANNDRSWFNANKERYERDVRDPALAFISDFAPHLERLSEHFVADPRPVGGSLFRIQRDIRFSRDKTPYKPTVGIQFRHERGKDAHAPGFYLHLEPGHVFAAAGIWRPDSTALHAIRAKITADPHGWRQVTTPKAFTALYHLEGESLKRPPAGYPADHSLVGDLKRQRLHSGHEAERAHGDEQRLRREVRRALRGSEPLRRLPQSRYRCRALTATAAESLL